MIMIVVTIVIMIIVVVIIVMMVESDMIFAICFLLEVPIRGFPFQMESFEKCRVAKNRCFIAQRISLEKEIPLAIWEN